MNTIAMMLGILFSLRSLFILDQIFIRIHILFYILFLWLALWCVRILHWLGKQFLRRGVA